MSLPPPCNTHRLRHMFATRSFNVSKALVSVQEMLGHASIQTTRICVQADLRAQREIVESVAVRSYDVARDTAIREMESRFVSIDVGERQ
ncbi:tyrosine-type recombinase/integrase [Leucobacter komagatae]